MRFIKATKEKGKKGVILCSKAASLFIGRHFKLTNINGLRPYSFFPFAAFMKRIWRNIEANMQSILPSKVVHFTINLYSFLRIFRVTQNPIRC